MPNRTRWWGTWPLAPRETGRWRIGPVTLWVERQPGELRIATEDVPEGEAAGVDIEVPCGFRDVWQIQGVARHAVGSGVSEIRLSPLLADRPVVTHPEKSIVIPRGETVTVYVATPLWLAITPGGSQPIEMPLLPPFETWFGPSPREGELCYASRNTFRLRLENLPKPPHRAITAVHVENLSHRPLPLQKMKLPVPFLTLYHGADDMLWTQDVIFQHVQEGEVAPLRLRDGAPSNALEPVLLANPRQRLSESVVARALSAWLARDEEHGR